jgi:hypothetical protein
MVALAVSLLRASDVVVAAVYCVAALPILAAYMVNAERVRSSVRADWVAGLRRIGAATWPPRVTLAALELAVPLFLSVGILFPDHVPADFGILATGLAAAMLIGWWSRPSAAVWMVRAGLYVGGAFVLYLSDGNLVTAAGGDGWLPVASVVNGALALMAVLVFSAIYPWGRGDFEMTPLDYLIAFAALASLALPDLWLGEARFGALAVKLVVWFFGVELVLSAPRTRLVRLGAVGASALFGLGIRAWWI